LPMLILRIGDPHAKVTNLDEMETLMEFVAQVAIERKVQRIEILGDLFHTHAILRLEVLEFWRHWLDHLSDICELVVLVGNHDLSGDFNSNSSALDIFDLIKKKNLYIINSARVLGIYGYVPYVHDNARFIEIANGLIAYGANILISHTTYNGARFESGMYAPDGVDPEALNFRTIISGHIHSRQRFVTSKGQQVIYPGTSRWDTNSDANEPKGLWLVNHDTNGEILSEEFIDTNLVCTPIISVQLKEGEELQEYRPGTKVTVELIGSSDWVAKQKIAMKGKYSVTAKITDKAKLDMRKSGGTFENFVRTLYPSTSDKDAMIKMAKEFGLV
jgi:DNA repair exonuclease SbcCD nuclease subunit